MSAGERINATCGQTRVSIGEAAQLMGAYESVKRQSRRGAKGLRMAYGMQHMAC